MGSSDVKGTYGRKAGQRKTHAQTVAEVREQYDQARVRRSAAVQDSYDTLGALLESGQPVRLIVEHSGPYELRWTLKAVLALPEGDYGVYMHGRVKHAESLPGVIDTCLQRGDWREDKYYKP